MFDVAKEIAQNPGLKIITFKTISEKLGSTKTNSKGLHYGNTMGINTLSGKNIGIIGTPYKVEEAYKLIECYLGADINNDIDKRPHPRRVEYNGYSFLITTYYDELLREVQLYGLESELEQSVGRARLLRNKCSVYIFSAFPCEQAEIHIGNYL